MIGALTTSRKATVGGLVAFLSPLYVLLQSGEPITWRAVLASLVAGALGYLTVYEATNTEAYEPRHAAEPEGG